MNNKIKNIFLSIIGFFVIAIIIGLSLFCISYLIHAYKKPGYEKCPLLEKESINLIKEGTYKTEETLKIVSDNNSTELLSKESYIIITKDKDDYKLKIIFETNNGKIESEVCTLDKITLDGYRIHLEILEKKYELNLFIGEEKIYLHEKRSYMHNLYYDNLFVTYVKQ